MHSTIYEITQNQVDPDEWATESNFYEDDNVDYTTLLTGDERTEAINDLYDSHLFSSLFSRGEASDTIVYNGNIKVVKEEWYQNLEQELQSLIDGNSCDTYRLRKAINQPFAGYTLFCLPGWAGSSSCYPRELLELLNTVEPGTVFHINSVFDYHW